MTTLDQISVNQVNQNGLENRSERERAVDRSLDQKANVTKVVRKANRKESDTRVRAVQKIVPMKALKPKAVHIMRKIKKNRGKRCQGLSIFFRWFYNVPILIKFPFLLFL